MIKTQPRETRTVLLPFISLAITSYLETNDYKPGIKSQPSLSRLWWLLTWMQSLLSWVVVDLDSILIFKAVNSVAKSESCKHPTSEK